MRATPPATRDGAGLDRAGGRDDGAGFAGLVVKAEGGVTRPAVLDQRRPLRVLLPRAPADDVSRAVIVNTGGGVVGGDRLRVEATSRAGARLLVTAQAAEKVYRSAGPTARTALRLEAGPGAWLEWLPQETILFDRCRLARDTEIVVAPGGRCLAGEMTVFGRSAHGERLTAVHLRDRWRVRRGERLVWADRFGLGGDVASRSADPFGLAGAAATATAVFAADDAAQHLDAARGLLPPRGDVTRAGATLLPGLLVVRWLGPDAARLRAAFGRFFMGFRHAAAGLPRRLPSLWQT